MTFSIHDLNAPKAPPNKSGQFTMELLEGQEQGTSTVRPGTKSPG